MVAVGLRRGERGNMTKHIKLSSLKQTIMKTKPKSCGVRYHVLSRARSHTHPCLLATKTVLYQRRRRRPPACLCLCAGRSEEAAHTRHHGANPSPGEYTSCCKIFPQPTIDPLYIDNTPDRFHTFITFCTPLFDAFRSSAGCGGSQPHDDISRSLLWVKQR